MAKELIDIYVEQGYEYTYSLDYNLYDGSDLENLYSCFFYSASIGEKEFSEVGNQYVLVLSEEDTGKLLSNLEEYMIYVVENNTLTKSKLVTGRIHVDKKVKE